MAKIDDLDITILSELSEDASISIPRLSEKIKVNPSVVYSRIKRLTKKKIIDRFTIIVNEKELGFGIKALTGLNMDSKHRDTIIDELFKMRGVHEISEVTGRFDIMVTMYAQNLVEMHKLISDGVGRIQGVLASESFIEMKRRTKTMPYNRVD